MWNCKWDLSLVHGSKHRAFKAKLFSMKKCWNDQFITEQTWVNICIQKTKFRWQGALTELRGIWLQFSYMVRIVCPHWQQNSLLTLLVDYFIASKAVAHWNMTETQQSNGGKFPQWMKCLPETHYQLNCSSQKKEPLYNVCMILRPLLTKQGELTLYKRKSWFFYLDWSMSSSVSGKILDVSS